jgi:hypothetical protein
MLHDRRIKFSHLGDERESSEGKKLNLTQDKGRI